MNGLTVDQLTAVVYACAAVAAVLFVLLLIVGGHYGARRLLGLDERTEREDANGCDLLRMARQMDACAVDLRRGGDAITHDELRQWARTCKRVAGEHLDTINALTLESLQKVGIGPVHLGAFSPPCAHFARVHVVGESIDPDTIAAAVRVPVPPPVREVRHVP
ncbi:MAG: hypothetical protein ACREPV_01325 [Lysobacter sp.]